MEIHYLTAHQLKDRLEKRQISCTEIVESVYLRIEEVGDRLNSYIRLEKESALSRAGEVDKLISAGSDRRFYGHTNCHKRQYMYQKYNYNLCIQNFRKLYPYI